MDKATTGLSLFITTTFKWSWAKAHPAPFSNSQSESALLLNVRDFCLASQAASENGRWFILIKSTCDVEKKPKSARILDASYKI